MIKGNISRIQHFSLGDGPGIRTTVFMQGCNLRCPWCHNPETIQAQSTLLCYESKCTLCGLCAKVCPQKAISFINEKRVVDDALCNRCGICENLCPSDAIVISGKLQTAEEVFAEIMKDAEFYPGSGGGVTFSGGEPLLQEEFCAEVARRCREQGIQVLVDTAGNVPYASFEKIIPYCDTFYFDLKASNAADFSAMCGGSFQMVTENLKRLAAATNVVVRMPVIPGYNDNAAYMEACGQLLSGVKANRVDLLPFHRMGSGKYKALGQVYDFDGTKPPDMAQMESLAEILRGCGLDCRIEK